MGEQFSSYKRLPMLCTATQKGSPLKLKSETSSRAQGGVSWGTATRLLAGAKKVEIDEGQYRIHILLDKDCITPAYSDRSQYSR